MAGGEIIAGGRCEGSEGQLALSFLDLLLFVFSLSPLLSFAFLSLLPLNEAGSMPSPAQRRFSCVRVHRNGP